MPLFVFTCLDKPKSLEVRLGAREAHLAWVKDQPLKFGGPFLDEAGDMAGSLMVVELADLAAAKAFSAADPYTKTGLWASVDIRPFRVTIDNR
ncbi:MAG: YciI family protein [Phenylobacterium sp.]|nr:MAG: YciI family protein [Phenylobacterium sp.]